MDDLHNADNSLSTLIVVFKVEVSIFEWVFLAQRDVVVRKSTRNHNRALKSKNCFTARRRQMFSLCPNFTPRTCPSNEQPQFHSVHNGKFMAQHHQMVGSCVAIQASFYCCAAFMEFRGTSMRNGILRVCCRVRWSEFVPLINEKYDELPWKRSQPRTRWESKVSIE